MPNTQYPSYPMRDWSSEISQPQPAATSSAAATSSTTTTTTTSSSSGSHTAGGHMPAMNGQAPAGQMPAVNSQASAGQTPAMTGQASAGQTPAMTGQASAGQTPAMNGQAPTGQTPAMTGQASAGQMLPMTGQAMMPSGHRNEFEGSIGTLDLQTHQPIEVVEAPASMNEAFLGSLKSMLLRNRGNFITATFLIGTQGTTSWEGILHDVGNDYVIIFQPGRHRYIACDIYSLKYIEFYDTRRQEMCETLLRQNGLQDQY